jgi:hypothetical protein
MPFLPGGKIVPCSRGCCFDRLATTDLAALECVHSGHARGVLAGIRTWRFGGSFSRCSDMIAEPRIGATFAIPDQFELLVLAIESVDRAAQTLYGLEWQSIPIDECPNSGLDRLTLVLVAAEPTSYSIDRSGPTDVREVVLAQIREFETKTLTNPLTHRRADTDFSWLGKSLKLRRLIYGIIRDLIVANRTPATRYSNSDRDASLTWEIRDAFSRLDRATNGIGDGRKYNINTVAGPLEDTTVIASKQSVDTCFPGHIEFA